MDVRRLGLLLLTALAVRCGTSTSQEAAPAPEPREAPAQTLLAPASAVVSCVGDAPQVVYNAPGYDKLSAAMDRPAPQFEWVLTDIGGHGVCWLLGVPRRDNPTPEEMRNKYVLKSESSFPRVNGHCQCVPLTTWVKEGVFRPKHSKKATPDQAVPPAEPGSVAPK
jgi:hypothetical protein